MTPPQRHSEKADAQITERVAVLGGGTSRVALDVAARLIDNGYNGIVLISRNSDSGGAAVEAIRSKTGTTPLHVKADLSQLDDALKAAQEVGERWSHVDTLVTTVMADGAPQIFSTMPISDISSMIETQLLPTMHLCRSFYPLLQAAPGGASVVNVASDAGKIPTPGESVIGGALAGIMMFSRTLALEGLRDSVRVNVVSPSVIDGTAGLERIMTDPFTARVMGKARDRAALGVPDVTDVGELIAFLATSASRRITGQVVSINGGISIS